MDIENENEVLRLPTPNWRLHFLLFSMGVVTNIFVEAIQGTCRRVSVDMACTFDFNSDEHIDLAK